MTLTGWLYEITESYDVSFYLAGLFIAISGVLLVILPALERVRGAKAACASGEKACDGESSGTAACRCVPCELGAREAGVKPGRL